VSNSLVIAAVTAALRTTLSKLDAPLSIDPQTDTSLTGADVTTLPPKQAAAGAEIKGRLNLFLFHVRPSAALRNLDVPASPRPGEREPLGLALDLLYLITAYGKKDDEVSSHRILGRAMAILQDGSVLAKTLIASELPQTPGRQIEAVRITPHPLDLEEMSKVWAMFQVEYRLSAAYKVTVLVIDSTRPIAAPLPVLRAAVTAASDVGPVLTFARPATGLPSVRFRTSGGWGSSSSSSSWGGGERVVLEGERLAGSAVAVLVRNPRTGSSVRLAPTPGATASRLQIELPASAAGWLAGPHLVSAVVSRPGEPDLTTNEIPLAVAPELLSVTPNPAHRGTQTTVTARVAPSVAPDQNVSLLVLARQVRAEARDALTDLVSFDIRALPAGTSLARVRVDGVDSNVADLAAQPPAFTGLTLTLT